MNRGIFVTGTDTGVGKTIVSALLARTLIKRGLNVGVMKPLETGCIKRLEKDGQEIFYPADGNFLRNIAGMKEPIEIITPFSFEYPLAPLVASDLEKKEIDIHRILESFEIVMKKYDYVIVEGVGGILVPIKRFKISDREKNIYYVSDLIKDIKLPTLLVARPTLGTINHTLLSIRHLLRENIEIKGIVINYNQPAEGSLAEKTNPEVIKELSPIPLLAIIPYIADISAENIDDLIERERLTEKFSLLL